MKQLLSQHSTFLRIVLLFLFSRGLLVLVAWFSLSLPPGDFQPPNRDEHGRLYAYSSTFLMDIWGRWDTGWYLNVTDNGYLAGPVSPNEESVYAFFPFFPLLIRGTTFLLFFGSVSFERYFLVGVVLSNIFFLIALFYLFKLALAHFKEHDLAMSVVLLFLFFPTSFFFSSPYTESLFLLVTVLSFYHLQKKNFLSATFFGCLATLTKFVGVFTFFSVYLSIVQLNQSFQSKIKLYTLALLIPTCLCGYLFFVQFQTGDFFLPFKVQSAWGRNLTSPFETFLHSSREDEYLIPLYKYFVAAFILLGILLQKSIRKSEYVVYTVGSLLLPLLTGNLESILRYYSVIFPIFFVAVHLMRKRKYLIWALLSLFLTLQVLFFIRWVRFYWMT